MFQAKGLLVGQLMQHQLKIINELKDKLSKKDVDFDK
jgi:hypothetical protein